MTYNTIGPSYTKRNVLMLNVAAIVDQFRFDKETDDAPESELFFSLEENASTLEEPIVYLE
ncbi:hypothetical protein AciPR4_1953 [Terriglobus saanensis SP1PR4]|uniref:Uncharacterized protein n=1 Tax=Terriglobus saanensis (strain ATCC BAA-1853 / DSM 23119 / SP1PR4) TaxID=401053 RepID=E8V6L8_TERSS|nr:hypothetical protein AciPR4_1953 [Terriglobus saanensis SP1PR4]